MAGGNGTTKAAKMLFNGKLFGSMTGHEANIAANNQQIHTSSGSVLATAKANTTFTGNVVVENGNNDVPESIAKLYARQRIQLQFGVVGTKVLTQQVVIEAISLSSDEAAGTLTGTINLMSLEDAKLV